MLKRRSLPTGDRRNLPFLAEASSFDRGPATNKVLLATSRLHENVGRLTVLHHALPSKPMQELVEICAEIFRRVDRDDPEQRTAARHAWLLKQTLLLTILQFDDPRLDTASPLGVLARVAVSVPGISDAVESLRALVAKLRMTSNLKRFQLSQILNDQAGSEGTSAIVVSFHGGRTPGWPAEIQPAVELGCPTLLQVRHRRDLNSEIFDRILIGGNPLSIPELLGREIFHGGRTARIEIAAYVSERATTPEMLQLPTGGFSRVPKRNPLEDKAIEASTEGEIDQWASNALWDSIHAAHAHHLPVSNRDATIAARFVLFADGSGTFLPDQHSVLEIGDVFADDLPAGHDSDPFHRKAVRELEEGDVVVLRLSGSGDHLDAVANALMAVDGEASLREEALAWKDRLHDALKHHGEGVVAAELRNAGLAMRNARYLWEWAGDAVMAPAEATTFETLIRTIYGLERRAGDADPSAIAVDKWRLMDRVRVYQYRAGQVIRSALLERVRALITAGTRVDDVMSIELPGVAAGRMGLMRVAAVDRTALNIPISRLYLIERVRDL